MDIYPIFDAYNFFILANREIVGEADRRFAWSSCINGDSENESGNVCVILRGTHPLPQMAVLSDADRAHGPLFFCKCDAVKALLRGPFSRRRAARDFSETSAKLRPGKSAISSGGDLYGP